MTWSCDGFTLLITFFLLIFSRRWFSIQKNQLVYQKKFKVIFFLTTCLGSYTTWVRQIQTMVLVVQDQPTVVVEDLRLCTVKTSAENERRFCFEVVSPSKWACVCVSAYVVRVLLLKQVSIDSEGIKRCSGLICMCCLVFECFVSLVASVGIALKLREKWWKGAAHFAPAL